MIYSRFGIPAEITGNLGEHSPWPKSPKSRLLRVRLLDERETFDRFYFQFSLRADGGYNEITEAVKAAPVVDLTKSELKAAILEAR